MTKKPDIKPVIYEIGTRVVPNVYADDLERPEKFEETMRMGGLEITERVRLTAQAAEALNREDVPGKPFRAGEYLYHIRPPEPYRQNNRTHLFLRPYEFKPFSSHIM